MLSKSFGLFAVTSYSARGYALGVALHKAATEANKQKKEGESKQAKPFVCEHGRSSMAAADKKGDQTGLSRLTLT